jgi:hypothetical protein
VLFCAFLGALSGILCGEGMQGISHIGVQIARGVGLGVGLAAVTWGFFGPVSAGAHGGAFGITGYLWFDGDAPSADQWSFYLLPFLLGIALWVASVCAVVKVFVLTGRQSAKPSNQGKSRELSQ